MFNVKSVCHRYEDALIKPATTSSRIRSFFFLLFAYGLVDDERRRSHQRVVVAVVVVVVMAVVVWVVWPLLLVLDGEAAQLERAVDTRGVGQALDGRERAAPAKRR